MNRPTPPEPPPRVVWVAYCTTCGEPFIAAKSKRMATRSFGCGCLVDMMRIRAAKYVLEPRKGK
jgi:hypothetical protein